MRSAPFALVFVMLAAVPLHADPEQPQSEAAALVAGVETIALPGVPGTLTVFGPHAFVVVEADSGGRPAALVGATRMGQGRAALFGHDYFGSALATGDTATLVSHVLRWAAGGSADVRVGVRGRNELARHLAGRGFTFVSLDGADWTQRLDDVEVVALPLAQVSEDELAILRQRLAAGLGVVSGMPGWGWQQLNPKKTLAVDNMANRLLAPAGLVWGGDYVHKPASGVLRVDGPASPLTHAGAALDTLVAQSEQRVELKGEEGPTAVATVARAIREVPPDDPILLPRLDALLTQSGSPRLVPTHAAPLTDAEGLAKLLLTLQLQHLATLDPERMTAHPAAAVFPGAVAPTARRVTRQIALDTTTPGWHSTGLYAPPGESIHVHLPPQAAVGDLELRIGAHKDTLWAKAEWHRAPQITVQRPLGAEHTVHACAFGGLIYVVVPERSALGSFEVIVEGAVAAPHYVLGQTTRERWAEEIRTHPAPWAELETKKVIITVPAEHVRTLEDPEALMRWWDRVMDGCADLAQIPRERVRPERYVADEQISAGYMHSGYPIMTHLDAAPRFVDLAHLATEGDWGMFHEMGHNHQHPDWTFDGTVEVTCNLFSLYLMETVCAKGVGHPAMAPESIATNRRRYVLEGASFDTWKSKPFTALIMYYELKQAFGWEAFRKVFAAYRDLAAAERPRTDEAKRDQWLVRMSRAVGRNLGPFFEVWGVPTSPEARETVQGLPPWTPEEPTPQSRGQVVR